VSSAVVNVQKKKKVIDKFPPPVEESDKIEMIV